MNRCTSFLAACAVVCLPLSAWAALPLITDDTGTQGKGKFQVEIGAAYDRGRETVDGTMLKETVFSIVSTLTYGVNERIDIFVNVPYAWSSSQSGDEPNVRVDGISDTALGIKRRFFDREGLSLGLKPFITVPSGNDAKTLGTGKVDYGVQLIGSKEAGPLELSCQPRLYAKPEHDRGAEGPVAGIRCSNLCRSQGSETLRRPRRFYEQGPDSRGGTALSDARTYLCIGREPRVLVRRKKRAEPGRDRLGAAARHYLSVLKLFSGRLERCIFLTGIWARQPTARCSA